MACCAKFAEMASTVSRSPLAIANAGAGIKAEAQFEKQDDGTWSINGCCGGGCYVVTDMTHCPFCGMRLDRDQYPPSTGGF